VVDPDRAVGRGPTQRIVPMKTFSAKAEEVKRDWFLVDASDKTLGRLCTEVARRLRGKHKPVFTPHVDTGDYIVVVNAAKLRVTGRKAERKTYYRHSGYPGGLKEMSFGKLHAAHPERVLEKAVKGMLPKGPLGYAMLRKLKVYAGGTHPHTAQQPKNLEI
jgi:large subunit ribosomal protein L13